MTRHKYNHIRSLDMRSLFIKRPWVLDTNTRLWKQAMSAFLDNSSNTDAHGTLWRTTAVVSSWARINKYQKSLDDIIAKGAVVPSWDNTTKYFMSIDDTIPDGLFQHWKQVIPGIARGYTKHSKLWAGFSDDIWSFCLAAGCPKADRSDPFKSLEALRYLVSRQLAYTTDLHNKISALSKQIILQQRMITALAYRDVLENLSAATEGRNATDKWHNFLDKMFHAVRAGKIPAGNPFTDLFDQDNIDKKYDFDYLVQMAKELYSTLSRTIHNFQPSKDIDQYTPMPGQFDPIQITFMAAMKPEKKNFNRDGNPNWDKERERYPGQVVDVADIAEALKAAKEDAEKSALRPKKDKKSDRAKGSGANFFPNQERDKQLLDEIDSRREHDGSNTGQGFTFEDDSSDSGEKILL
jgi:hypothetical protein